MRRFPCFLGLPFIYFLVCSGLGFDDVDDNDDLINPDEKNSKVKRHNEKILRKLCRNVNSETSGMPFLPSLSLSLFII